MNLVDQDKREITKYETENKCKVVPVEYEVEIHQDLWAVVSIEASSAAEAKRMARVMLNKEGIYCNDIVFTSKAKIGQVNITRFEEIEDGN